MVLFSFWVTFIHNVCLFVSFPFVIWCLLCQYFFPPSGIQSVRVLSKTDGHLLLVHVATQMVPPASHTEPPAKVYIYWKLSSLYRVNPISSQRAWHKCFQFLCRWVLWWPSLPLRTQEMSDLGTVPGLLFGLLPSILWSRCLCAELWGNTGHFPPLTPVPSSSQECLCHRDGSHCETQTFPWGCKGFSVLTPARDPL